MDSSAVSSQVEAFNKSIAVGDPVWLELDDGHKYATWLRTPAWVLGSGVPVASVVGKTGGWRLDRITPRPGQLGMVPNG